MAVVTVVTCGVPAEVDGGKVLTVVVSAIRVGCRHVAMEDAMLVGAGPMVRVCRHCFGDRSRV